MMIRNRINRDFSMFQRAWKIEGREEIYWKPILLIKLSKQKRK